MNEHGTPLFSVIIPTHGRPLMLGEALESVQAQTVADWECIVAVDGGEPPQIPSDRRIRVVVRSENGGAAAARNTGMDEAVGANIAFLDDDDLWVPERLEIALEGLERAPVVACFGLTDGRTEWQGSWEGDVSDTILDTRAPSVNGLAVRRDVCVPFDEEFRGAEDVEWLLRLARKAAFTTVPRPGFVRRNAGTERADASLRLEGINLLMRRHASYFRSHPIAAARSWRYCGDVSMSAGRRRAGRRAYVRSFRHQPRKLTARSWLRTWKPEPSL